MNLFNDLVSFFIRRRMEQIDDMRKNPVETQQRVFKNLVNMGRQTEWGKQYDYKSIKTIQDFQQRFPVQDYEDLKPYIERIMQGEQQLLWPTKTNWFAKSSGTTSDKSKFIPVTPEALEECHFKGGKDALSVYCHHYPDSKVFTGKALVMGGSNKPNPVNKESFSGDVSAVMLQNLPFIAEYFRTPNIDIALMDEWEEKLQRMAEATIKDNVTHLAGVPSWTLVLMKKVLEITGKNNIGDVWPNLEVFIHGGVSFKPYREQFREVMSPNMRYLETYNASEGFIALQDDPATEDLLLLLDYGVFYEFIPMEHAQDDNPPTLLLDEVEVGQQYAVVMSSNAGLWRYKIGDTVRFTSKYPFKIEISGRVKHFINAFGEEVVVDNTDKALAAASTATGAQAKDYSATPVFTGNGRGYHHWLIEFEKMPNDVDRFTELLDSELQSLNSDYEAKRYKNMVLDPLKLTVMPHNSFYNWLKSKGKLGGQNKVPRLSNDDKYVKELLEVNEVFSR